MKTHITNFVRDLDRYCVTSGSHFAKADFHIHLPGSSDYEFRGEDAYEEMGRAITAADLRVATIVKHQEFPTIQELSKLQKYCQNTLLLPGAEINIFVDALNKKVGKDYYYHCLVIGDQHSDYDYPLRKAQKDLSYRGTGDYPSGFDSSVKDVAKVFVSEGQLFIPAHLHQKNSVENSRAIDDVYDDEAFLGLVQAGCFSALEVRKAETAAFFVGNKKTPAGLMIPHSICLQSSDAHHHDHISQRNRHTWIQIEKASFSEVKAALEFPHRVRLAKPSEAQTKIIGLHIVGQFLTEQWIKLNPGINAFIGCKGSGKTSVLECIRFVMNTAIPDERKDSVNKHLQHILGPSGFVECLIQKSDGTKILFTRRSDSPDRILMTKEDGTSEEISKSQGRLADINILGWHEIEAVADHPQARTRLIDQTNDYESIRSLYESTNSYVEEARNTMPLLQAAIRRFKRAKATYQDVKRKRETLKKLEQADLFAIQQKYERLVGLIGQLEALKGQMGEAATSIDDIQKTRLSGQMSIPSSLPSDPEWLSSFLNAAKDENELKINASRISNQEAKDSLDNAGVVLIGRIADLTKRFQEFRTEEYEPCIAGLGIEERQILTEQIKVIEETRGLPAATTQAETAEGQVKSIAGKMVSICKEICSLRSRVKQFRQGIIKQLNEEIDSLELRLLPAGDQTRRSDYSKTHSEKAQQFWSDINQYEGNELYEKLEKLFSELTSISKDDSSSYFKDPLTDAQFVDLLEVADDDDIEIKMRVGLAGMVPIQNLSAGQRCTAVFPLLLRNNRGPLVIDQPEDNLDNRHIADVVAPELLSKSEHQQFFLTSHNANLVVLTDAGLIVHVDSDGRTGRLEHRGFLACHDSSICKSVVEVLDGGRAALEARRQKYGEQR